MGKILKTEKGKKEVVEIHFNELRSIKTFFVIVPFHRRIAKMPWFTKKGQFAAVSYTFNKVCQLFVPVSNANIY